MTTRPLRQQQDKSDHKGGKDCSGNRTAQCEAAMVERFVE